MEPNHRSFIGLATTAILAVAPSLDEMEQVSRIACYSLGALVSLFTFIGMVRRALKKP